MRINELIMCICKIFSDNDFNPEVFLAISDEEAVLEDVIFDKDSQSIILVAKR